MGDAVGGFCFFFDDTATTEIYTLSLHDALPISAASRSCRRWKVVHTVPRPRARAASMKLHAAGMIDAQREACTPAGAPSVLPSTHGMTCTGTWWMWSARCRT